MRGDLAALARRHAPPLVMAAASVAVGMAYSLLWAPLVRHHSYWMMSGDLWATVRSAHVVAWGDLGGVYAGHAGLVSLPGLLVVLAPLVMLTGALGLAEGSVYSLVAHPASWLVIGPVVLAMGTLALFALDALARRCGVTGRQRWGLGAVEAAALWPVVAIWGHPEDLVALGLGTFALVAVLDRRGPAAGWLLGAALAIQPLTVLLVPIVAGAVVAARGWRAALGVVVRAGTLPGLLLAVTLLGDPSHTWAALVHQPNYPTIDHPTPLLAFSPHLSANAVAAGPSRLVAVALAVAVGWLVSRRRPAPLYLVWAAGVAMAGRCLFESVMVPYYVAPAVALLLLAAWPTSPRVRARAAAAGLALVVVTHWWLKPWPYWLATILLLGILAFLGRRAPASATLTPGAVTGVGLGRPGRRGSTTQQPSVPAPRPQHRAPTPLTAVRHQDSRSGPVDCPDHHNATGRQPDDELVDRWEGSSAEHSGRYIAMGVIAAWRESIFYRCFGADGVLGQVIRSGESILDVGCSDGRGSSLLGEHVAAGTDIYLPALKSARQSGRRNQVTQADVRRLPFRSRSFDVVASLDVVEHFDKGEALILIGELERVARRAVVLMTPCGFMPQPAEEDEPWQEHRCGFDAHELVDLGYRVRGQGGPAVLRGTYGSFRGGCLGQATALACTPLMHRFPSIAFHLVATKEMGHAS